MCIVHLRNGTNLTCVTERITSSFIHVSIFLNSVKIEGYETQLEEMLIKHQ